MAKYLLNLSDERMDDLRKLSARTRIPIVQHIRQAVDNYFNSGYLSCGLVISGQVTSGCVIVLKLND